VFSQAALRAVGWAIVHSLWQGALVALAFACVSSLARGAGAHVRYACACVALALMLSLTVATACLGGASTHGLFARDEVSSEWSRTYSSGERARAEQAFKSNASPAAQARVARGASVPFRAGGSADGRRAPAPRNTRPGRRAHGADAAATRSRARARAGARQALRLPRQPFADGGRSPSLLSPGGVVALAAFARRARARVRRRGGRGRGGRRALVRARPRRART